MSNSVFSSTDKCILWVRNSFFYYNNGINHHLREFVRANIPTSTYRGTAVTISGSGLDWHDVEFIFAQTRLGGTCSMKTTRSFSSPAVSISTRW